MGSRTESLAVYGEPTRSWAGGAPGGSATGVDVVTIGSGETVVIEFDVTVTKQNILALLAVIVAVGNRHRLTGTAGVGIQDVVITAVTGRFPG